MHVIQPRPIETSYDKHDVVKDRSFVEGPWLGK